MRRWCTLLISNCLESRSANTSTSTVRMLHEALVAIMGHCWIRVTYTWELARWTMSTMRSTKRWNTGSKTSRNRHTSRQHRHRLYRKHQNKTLRSSLRGFHADWCVTSSGRKGGVIDFSIVTPAAESYCAQAAKIPLHAAKTREETKILNTFKRIRSWTTHTSSLLL